MSLSACGFSYRTTMLPEMTATGKAWSMDKLAAGLKLESAKSLPPLMMQFRKDVNRLGFEFNQVITRKIAYTGGRKYSFYTPGPKAAEALKAAEEREKSSLNLFVRGSMAAG